MVIWYEYRFEDGFVQINRGNIQKGEMRMLLRVHGNLLYKKEAWRE